MTAILDDDDKLIHTHGLFADDDVALRLERRDGRAREQPGDIAILFDTCREFVAAKYELEEQRCASEIAQGGRIGNTYLDIGSV